jgi:hypothetical protein
MIKTTLDTTKILINQSWVAVWTQITSAQHQRTSEGLMFVDH